MVGVVIVSHSKSLAESIVEYTRLMAGEAKVAAAGGTDEGTFGTSFQKIYEAIDAVYSEDGVVVLMDMGSAVMTTEMVLESYPESNVRMVDCPIVEGAVVATINAQVGMDLDALTASLEEVHLNKKF